MHSHAMTEADMEGLLHLLSQFAFREAEPFMPGYKYDLALLIFAASQGLHPAVGFEAPLEKYCLEVQECHSALVDFFRVHHLNLAITDFPIAMIYNTNLPPGTLEQRPDEDPVQYFGRIFGYWTPLTKEEYENEEIPKDNVEIYILFAGDWRWISGFNSVQPIVIEPYRLRNLRHTFDVLHIPPKGIRISLSAIIPEQLQQNVALLFV